MTREVFVFSTFSLLTEEYQQAPSAIQAIRYVCPRGGFVWTGSGGFQTHWGMLIGTPPKQEESASCVWHADGFRNQGLLDFHHLYVHDDQPNDAWFLVQMNSIAIHCYHVHEFMGRYTRKMQRRGQPRQLLHIAKQFDQACVAKAMLLLAIGFLGLGNSSESLPDISRLQVLHVSCVTSNCVKADEDHAMSFFLKKSCHVLHSGPFWLGTWQALFWPPSVRLFRFFRGHLSGSGGMHASASHPIYLQCRWQLKFDLSLFGSDISQRMHHIIHVDWKQDRKSIDLRQREFIS